MLQLNIKEQEAEITHNQKQVFQFQDKLNDYIKYIDKATYQVNIDFKHRCNELQQIETNILKENRIISERFDKFDVIFENTNKRIEKIAGAQERVVQTADQL